MRRLLTLAATLGALVPLLAGTFVPASARPLADRDLLTPKQAASVYPGLRHGTRLKGSYSITAPRFAMVHGKLKCDRSERFPGKSRRSVYMFNL
ncbi:MAG: hypothetical protein L0K86_19810, partial [Actinomycetia bacterium]|nr:hypothetical protein [Actinomycetes bacterium]